MKIIIIFVMYMLIACNGGIGTTVDQCLRRDLFQQCLKIVQYSHENYDLSDVVSSCDSASYYQSISDKTKIKEECRL